MSVPPPLHALRALAAGVADRAVVPFSGLPAGSALLLADGSWVPGVRVESGSFPLTIPALQGAYVAAVCAGRRAEVVAAATSRPLERGEAEWLAAALGREPRHVAPDVLAFADGLPSLGAAFPLAVPSGPPGDDAEGLDLARQAADRAYAPHSDFPVGCVLLAEDTEGRPLLVPGANVEHDDWTRGLCAERTALATAFALGARRFVRAYLTCPKAPGCSPCGGCRQLLAEHLAGVPLVIDRGDLPPEVTTPDALLPHFFSGDTLRR
jgi:cytidine deaminase